MSGFRRDAISKIFTDNFATWGLVLLSVVLVMFFVERTIFLHSRKVRPQQFLEGIFALLKSSKYNEALTICEESPGAVALIVKTALTFRKNSYETIFNSLKNVILLEIPLLERRLNSIRLVSKISPIVSFIGVLQLLSKMIFGMKNSAYFSSNLALNFLQTAAALVAFGLFLNAVGILIYSFLYGRVRRLTYDMEWTGNEVLSYLQEVNNSEQHAIS